MRDHNGVSFAIMLSPGTLMFLWGCIKHKNLNTRKGTAGAGEMAQPGLLHAASCHQAGGGGWWRDWQALLHPSLHGTSPPEQQEKDVGSSQ